MSKMIITSTFEKILKKLGKNILKYCELPKNLKQFVTLEHRAFWLDFEVRYNGKYIGTLKIKDENNFCYITQNGLQNKLTTMVMEYATKIALQEVTQLNNKINELKKEEDNYLRRLNSRRD